MLVELIPRRTDQGVPVWDATDEMYITYNKEGERVLITTGQMEIWNQEHSYQTTGSAHYEALRGLNDGTPGRGRDGDAPVRTDGGYARDPSARGRTAEPTRIDAAGWRQRAERRSYPPILIDRNGDYAWGQSGGGARSDTQVRGARVDGPIRDTRHRVDGSRLSERPRVRTHRHCPGCAGHDRVASSIGIPFLKGLFAWFLGWVALWGAGVYVNPFRYVILTASAILVVVLARPLWREYVGHKDFKTRGGTR